MNNNSSKKITAKKKEQDKQRAYRKNKLFRRIEADIKDRDRRRIPGKSNRNFKIIITQPFPVDFIIPKRV
jgi:hypothetical protein